MSEKKLRDERMSTPEEIREVMEQPQTVRRHYLVTEGNIKFLYGFCGGFFTCLVLVLVFFLALPSHP